MASSSNLSGIITVPEPFSFKQILGYLQRSPNECLYQIREGRIYRAIASGPFTAVIEIREIRDNTLQISFQGGTAPSCPLFLTNAINYVKEWFDLDRDLLPFYQLAQRDKLLKHAISSFPGLRIVGIPDLFEAISWGILGQQIHLQYAYTLKRRFVERYGRHIACNGERYWLYPSAAEIAALTTGDLADLRMTVKKCEYLIGTAQLIAEGKLTKEQLQMAGCVKEAEKQLVSIRGIGPWTANYVLMRCLRMPSALPVDDVGLHHAIKHLTGSQHKPTKQQIRSLFAAWPGWEAYATFYLWRFLY